MIYSRHKLTVRRVRDKLVGPELFITQYSWGPTDTCRDNRDKVYSVSQLKTDNQQLPLHALLLEDEINFKMFLLPRLPAFHPKANSSSHHLALALLT